MAVKNSFSVVIDGINRTRKCVFPIKFANLLDERLDECYLTLRHIKVQHFKPFTPVEITFHNKVYFADTDVYANDTTIKYFVANDSNAVESPIGSGLYNHELYLIEQTKYLEAIFVDTLTFRNDIGKNYTNESQLLAPQGIIFPTQDSGGQNNQDRYIKSAPAHYISPILPQKNFSIVPISNIFNLKHDNNYHVDFSTAYNIEGSIRVYRGSSLIANWSGTDKSIADISQTIDFSLGTWTVEYYIKYLADGPFGGTATDIFQATYTFIVVSNQYPLKRLTCKDVLLRLCDLAEPLRLGQKTRFVINPEQLEYLDSVYAPEFSMTRMNLRECLKEVGKVIHAEPRAEMQSDGTILITYVFYGGVERSNISKLANIYKSSSSTIEQYCTSIDTTAQNLINQTDWMAGVIVEPNKDDFRTVRAETQYVRITDSNMEISTDRPIYTVRKLEILNAPTGESVDITPYVVESTIYNSQLSSYKKEYPYSKAYGLYFTQGQKNIKGLNFKVEHPVDQIFENYAIVNILRRALKDENLSFDSTSYPDLAFRVTYIPYFDVRIAQTKSYYKDYDKHIAIAYNQSANTIESKYYGENLKGVVARLGNPEVSITYMLSRWTQIPKAGELYDDEHYISAVSVEFLPTVIKCTIGLSKDFNRLNEYVGISSEKRYYEVSEKQTYDRNVLYHEYIVVGDKEESDVMSLIGPDFMAGVADTFNQEGVTGQLTSVIAWGGTYDNAVKIVVNDGYDSPLPCVRLPVVSTAFGNSMAFIWNYQDNYSAGAVVTNMGYTVNDGKDNIVSNWQNDYQYTDYYGKMFYYNFDVVDKGYDAGVSNKIAVGRMLPQGAYPESRSTFLSTGESPYIFRKDSAEIPQINVQVEFVTNRKDLIIGSALASSCPLIRGADSTLKAQLYVLDTPINKFTRELGAKPELFYKNLPAPVEIAINPASVMDSTDIFANRYVLTSKEFTAENLSASPYNPNGLLGREEQYTGKSWVIITGFNAEEQTVVDDYGNVTTQYIQKGGEVLLACNGTFNVGDNIGEIFFTPKRKLFNNQKEDL